MIIGLSGPLCAGTDTFGEILKKELNFIWMSYSDILREEARSRNIELTRKNLQDLGNELREKRGPGVLSELLIEKMEDSRDYVIGNIRNPGEVEVLRKKFGKEFLLIHLDATPEIRFQRLLKRRREKDPETWEGFLKVEARDLGKNESESGQQHQKVFELADLKVENNESYGAYRRRILLLIKKLKQKQIAQSNTNL